MVFSQVHFNLGNTLTFENIYSSRNRARRSINIPEAAVDGAMGSGRRPYHYRSQTNVTEGTPLVGRVDADPGTVLFFNTEFASVCGHHQNFEGLN